MFAAKAASLAHHAANVCANHLHDNKTKPLTRPRYKVNFAAAYELWLVLGCFCVNRAGFEHEQVLQTFD